MTGYGYGEASADGIRVEVELSSVNRRQFDVHVTLPRGLATCEPLINAMIHKAVTRGSITGVVNVSPVDLALAKSVRVNVPLAQEYAREIREATAQLGLKLDLSARWLLELPGVVSYEPVAQDSHVLWPLAQRAMRSAIKGLVRMRQREGRHLARDLAQRFNRLHRYLLLIRRRAPKVAMQYRRLLRQRLERAGVPTGQNDPQLVREIALFAERCDITEEIVRLESHLAQARKLLHSPKPVGRTLDFLCQELFREVTTIGAKANDGLIARHVIKFKAELEAIREQIQNIE